MSITFHIAAATEVERRALDTEGAPTLSVTTTNGYWIQHILGLTPTPDGDIDPAELLDRIDAAADPAGYLARRLPLLADIARAAARPGRHVAWT